MVPELTVSDFGKSLVFYRDLLGFKVRNQRIDPDFAYLEQETVQIMIEKHHDESWQTGDLQKPYGRGINLQIELSGIDAILDRLNEAGHPVFEDMEEEWYDTGETLSGQKQFLVQDPDGYLLRFTEFLGEKPKD